MLTDALCLLSAVAICFLVSGSGTLLAHNAHDKEIHRLDQQLQQLDTTDSDSIKALLRRADLHRKEKKWQPALVDYANVEKIQPDNPHMLLGIAQLYLDQHDFQKALQWSFRLLARQANHVQALLIQSRAQLGLGNLNYAADLYSRAISHMGNPTPQHYLEHAHIVLQTEAKRAIAQAISIVDRGAQRLNHPVSLHSFALEQELVTKRWAAAIRRIDQLVMRNPSLTSWKLKKAELLLSLHRIDEACRELRALEMTTNQLPIQRRNTRAMQSIESRLNELDSACSNHHRSVEQ